MINRSKTSLGELPVPFEYRKTFLTKEKIKATIANAKIIFTAILMVFQASVVSNLVNNIVK